MLKVKGCRSVLCHLPRRSYKYEICPPFRVKKKKLYHVVETLTAFLVNPVVVTLGKILTSRFVFTR